MRIVVTGGGSGGHITPVLAVAHELKQQQPDAHITYIGQTGDKLADIPAEDPSIDEARTVRAGKFRRYHGEGARQLLDIPTLLKNIRDAFMVLIGIGQAFWLLKKIKPQVIFIKGGFVGVPVGLAAAVLRIPYITHDSDALPGLANRIVAPWARLHAVALPKEIYAYPQDKTETVGVPLTQHFHKITSEDVRAYREQIGIPIKGRVLLVTGGGLGAQRVNEAVVACIPNLMQRYSDLTILILAGRMHEATVRKQCAKQLPTNQQARVVVRGFATNLYMYSGAADVIITRAGATSIAEFAAQEKACVVIPNPVLTGGHQLKNGKVLVDRKAVRMVADADLKTDPLSLMAPVVDLLDSLEVRLRLGKKLALLTQGDASKRLAVLLLKIVKESSK